MTAGDRLKPVFVCIQCQSRFSVLDAEYGHYEIETHICSDCYRGMLAAGAADCCFGKLYDPAVDDCSRICIDRNVCAAYERGIPRLLRRKLPEMRNRVEQEAREAVAPAARSRTARPFQNRPAFAFLLEQCRRGITRQELKQRIEELGLPQQDTLVHLVSGKSGRFRWTYTESRNGQIKVVMHRPAR